MRQVLERKGYDTEGYIQLALYLLLTRVRLTFFCLSRWYLRYRAFVPIVGALTLDFFHNLRSPRNYLYEAD